MVPGSYRLAWTLPTAPSAALVAMLAAEARARRRPYRVPAPGAGRTSAARVEADRVIRRYRLATL